MSASLAPTPGGTLARGSVAEARDAADDRAQSSDPWIRSHEWARMWLASHYRSPGTAEQYRRCWASIDRFAELLGRAPLTWARRDIDAWAAALRTIGDPAARQPRPLADSTLAQRLAIASSYYAYAVDGGCPGIERNPVPRKGRPRAPTESPQQYLTPGQVRAIIAEADQSPQDAALVALLLCCLRVTEAISVNVEDLAEDGGHHIITVTRKGGKRQKIPVPPAEWRKLRTLTAGRDSGPVLDPQPSRRSAAGRVATLARRAGIPGRVSPHTFRHACITYALARGAALEDVQAWAGHSDPRTTLRYARQRGNLDRSPAYRVADGYYGGTP